MRSRLSAKQRWTQKAGLADTEAKAGRVRQRALDTFTEQAGPINETLAAIRTNRNAFTKREQTKATIAQMDAELDDLRADVERQRPRH